MIRCFQSKDYVTLYKAFTTYVRPILEYCCNVWSPYRICDIRRIESVQRCFTKRLGGLQNLSYTQRLVTLKSEPLEIRRVKSDLCMYYKIIHDLLSVDSKFALRESHTRSNGKSISMPKWHGNMERYIFHSRCVNIWNNLPAHVVSAVSFSSFCNALSSVDISSVIRKSVSLCS